jgi:Peptidase propeptide and YPEB domain.
MNKIPALIFALTLGALSLPGTAMAEQQAMTEPQVQSELTAQGYTKIHELKFKDGMWRTEARSADGDKVDLRIDAKTGQVYPDKQVSKLSKQDVRAALESQGYTHVHDVDFDDGIWKAKARNPSGNKVKLRIDADTGKVIGID